jgi:hypothetical protein
LGRLLARRALGYAADEFKYVYIAVTEAELVEIEEVA